MKYFYYFLIFSSVNALSAQISFTDKTNFAGLGGDLLNNGLSLGDYDNDGGATFSGDLVSHSHFGDLFKDQ